MFSRSKRLELSEIIKTGYTEKWHADEVWAKRCCDDNRLVGRKWGMSIPFSGRWHTLTARQIYDQSQEWGLC